MTDVLGADYGVIEDGRDGYAIIEDAARFLRHPGNAGGRRALPATRRGPRDWVRAVADSRPPAGIGRSGQNRDKGGALTFDGILAGVGGGEVPEPQQRRDPTARTRTHEPDVL